MPSDPPLPTFTQVLDDSGAVPDSDRVLRDARYCNLFRAAYSERLLAKFELLGTPELYVALPDAVVGDDALDSFPPTFANNLTMEGFNQRAYDSRATHSTWMGGTFDYNHDPALQPFYQPRFHTEARLSSRSATGTAPNGTRAMVVEASSAAGTNTGKIFLKTSGAWAYEPGANEDPTDAHYGLTDVLEFRDTSYATVTAYTDLTDRPTLADARYFNELRDLLGMAVMTELNVVNTSPATWVDVATKTNWGYGIGSTAEEAYGAASADFTGLGNISFEDFNSSDPNESFEGPNASVVHPGAEIVGADVSCFISGATDNTTGETDYECYLYRTQWQFKIVNGATTKAYLIYLAMYSGKYGVGGGFVPEYNANGDNVVDSTFVPGVSTGADPLYHKNVWTGAGGEGNSTSDWIGDYTVVPEMPTIATDTSDPDLTTYQGYSGYYGSFGSCFLSFLTDGGFEAVI